MSETIQQAAAALAEARRSRTPIEPISATYGVTALEDAYAVAAVNTGQAIKAGSRVTGIKAGLTSKAVQAQLGVDQPDFGVLFEDMELRPADGVDTSRLIQPKAEGEVAFVVGRDLTDDCLSWGRFLLGVEYALAAIEIVDSAIADWRISLADTVADNASCGLYMLGDRPRRLGELDLGACSMTFQKNEQTASIGTGAACLGHPLNAAYWVARTMLERGKPLRAGDVILSGALGPMFTFDKGDRLRVEIAGLGGIACQTF